MAKHEWTKTTLGEVVDLLTGFPFKSAEFSDDPTNPKLLRGDNVVQGAFRWEGAKYWPRDRVDGLAQYSLRAGDVILAMDRPWIEAGLKRAMVRDSDLPALLVQRVSRLRAADDKVLDQGFLRYIIDDPTFTEYIVAVQTGTSVPHISGAQIKGYEFNLPPLPQQRAIARVLGALDDKIELNRRMNRTLEDLARGLFRSWFVDFDPVTRNGNGKGPAAPAGLFPKRLVDSSIGPIPEGWRVSTIGEEVTVVGGSTPSTDEPKFWEAGTHCWVTPRDLSRLTDPVVIDCERRITDAGITQISSGLMPRGTVLLSSRAPIGYLAIADVPVAVNQGFIALKCDKGLPGVFALRWCEANMDEVLSRAGGTTFAEISKAAFRPIPMVVPSAPVLAHFERAALAWHERIVANVRQSRSLAALRDALLPQLLSGEIRLRDAEVVADKAVQEVLA